MAAILAEAIRYVERNPVRAGLSSTPWDYPWSSAQAHLGKEYRAIRLADISEAVAVSSWVNYLMEEEREERLKLLRKSTQQGLALGPTSFIQELEQQFRVSLQPKERGRPRKK